MRLRALALLLVASAFGDARQKSVEPGALYGRALQAFNRGALKKARQLSETGMARFGGDAKWNELFACVGTEALSREKPAEAAELLARTPRSGDPEATVRRYMAQGYLLAIKKEKSAAAAAEYRKAAVLAARVWPALRAEVAVRRATPSFYDNDYQEIERYCHEAMRLADPKRQPFVYANALGMLATASFQRRDYQQAIERTEPALRFARSIGANSSESKMVGNLGWSYMQLGDVENARAAFSDALVETEAQGDALSQSTWLANIANVYVTEQRLPEALPYAQRAVEIARRVDEPKRLFSTLVNLAEVEIELGRWQDAKTHNEQALAMRTRDRSYALLNAARIEAGSRPDAALEQLAAIARSDNLTLRWHSQFFMASLLQDLHRIDEAKRAYEAALNTADEARVENRPEEAYLFAFESLLIRFYDRYIELLLDAGSPREALRVAERSRARTLREGIGLEASSGESPEALARAQDSTILLYWLGEHRSLLWVVTPAGVFVERLQPAAAIEQEIDAYRREILAKSTGLQSAHASKLFEMLVRPALGHSPAERFIVIPDGSLSQVGLEALVNAKTKRYWLEDSVVSYAPSLASISTTTGHHRFRDSHALLMGDVPAFGAFPSLPYAGREIERIAPYFADRCRIITGASATPAAFLAADLKQVSHIHFAAHATANVRAPLSSAVILAGGPLSAESIAKAPLSGTALVTISACSSAGRRTYAGEGPVGLAWAFLRAGAKRVVASQWDVSDVATANVMDGMYRALAADRLPAEALREAKLELVRSRDPKYSRPYYWAPFILYGAP